MHPQRTLEKAKKKENQRRKMKDEQTLASVGLAIVVGADGSIVSFPQQFSTKFTSSRKKAQLRFGQCELPLIIIKAITKTLICFLFFSTKSRMDGSVHCKTFRCPRTPFPFHIRYFFFLALSLRFCQCILLLLNLTI